MYKRNVIKNILKLLLILSVSVAFFVPYVGLGFIMIFISNHNIGPVIYFLINLIISFFIYSYRRKYRGLAIAYLLINTFLSLFMFMLYEAMMGV